MSPVRGLSLTVTMSPESELPQVTCKLCALELTVGWISSLVALIHAHIQHWAGLVGSVYRRWRQLTFACPRFCRCILLL